MKLRKLLIEALQYQLNQYNELDIQLELSGGCDSISLFVCLVDMNIQFTCHTYYYKNNPDLRIAKQITAKYGVKHIIYPINANDIINGENWLRSNHYPTNDVSIDCLIGHIPIAQNVKNSIVISGDFADTLWGAFGFMSRLKYEDPDNFMQKRLEMIKDPNAAGMQSLSRLFAINNNVVIFPYTYQPLVQEFLELPLSLLNDKKIPFYEEFQVDIADLKVRRRSQQITSGIRDFRKNYKSNNQLKLLL